MINYMNRTKLRFLSVLMVIALAVSLGAFGIVSYSADEAVTAPQGEEVFTHGAFEYTVDKDGAHIKKFTGQASDVSIPATIDGHTVVTIGLEAFWYCDFLYAVNIPGTITCIEAKAFQGCKNLSYVNIPDSVIEIGDAAFEGCENLADINIPDELLYVGGYAFDRTEWIKKYEANTSIIFEGKHFYKYNGNAPVVNIPDGVISISSNAFASNQNVVYVNIPDTVRFYGAFSFYNCPNLKSLSVADDVAFIGGNAFGVDSFTKEGQPVYTEGFTLFANKGTNGEEYCKLHSMPREDRAKNVTPDELPPAEKTIVDSVYDGDFDNSDDREVKNLGVLITIVIVTAVIIGGLYTYFTIKEKKEQKALKEKKKQNQNKNKKKKSKKK